MNISKDKHGRSSLSYWFFCFTEVDIEVCDSMEVRAGGLEDDWPSRERREGVRAVDSAEQRDGSVSEEKADLGYSIAPNDPAG